MLYSTKGNTEEMINGLAEHKIDAERIKRKTDELVRLQKRLEGLEIERDRIQEKMNATRKDISDLEAIPLTGICISDGYDLYGDKIATLDIMQPYNQLATFNTRSLLWQH